MRLFSGLSPPVADVQRQAQITTFPDGLSILHRVVLCTRFGTYLYRGGRGGGGGGGDSRPGAGRP
jgi:hypothetical protein